MVYLRKHLEEFAENETTFLSGVLVYHFMFFLVYDYLSNNKNNKQIKITIKEIEMLCEQNSICKEFIQLEDNESNNELLDLFYDSLNNLSEKEKKHLQKFLFVYLTCSKQIMLQHYKKLQLFQYKYNENLESIKKNDILVSFLVLKNLINEYTLRFNLSEEYSIFFYFYDTYRSSFNRIFSKIVNISKIFKEYDLTFDKSFTYFLVRYSRIHLRFKEMIDDIIKLKNESQSNIDLTVLNEMCNCFRRNYLDLYGIKIDYKSLFKIKRNDHSLKDLQTLATCYGTSFTKSKNLNVKESPNGFMILYNNYLLLNENTLQQGYSEYNGEFEILDNNEVFNAASNEYRLKYVFYYTLFNEKDKQFKVELELCKDKKGIVLKVNEKKSFTIKFNSENKCCKVWNIIIQQRELEWNKNYKQKKLFNTVPLYLNDISFSFN